MREIAPGLWHWSAPHPDWTPEEGGPNGWPQEVSSYAVDDSDWLAVIDPVAPPSLLDGVADGRRPLVVLTCPWHERDSAAVIERLGAAVHAPAREPGQDGLVLFEPGAMLPGGIEALPALEENDLILWIPAQKALVFGDVLIDRGNGLEIPVTWTPVDVPREERAARLRPLLDLPVEWVLPTHGSPAGRDSLENALAP